MRPVRLTLDFVCCHCGGPVAVTVECSGRGLDDAAQRRAVAAVGIPCPDCQRINQLYFDAGGTVHAVEPYRTPQRTPEPSLN